MQINNATSFSYQTQGANSHYHAAQVRITRRLSRCVSANSLYTFAKGIDDASSFNGTGGTVVQFLNNRALERGLSTFDVRHNLATGFQLSSPVGVRGLLRNGGWRTKLLRELEHERQFHRDHGHAADGARVGQPGQYGRTRRAAAACARRPRDCRSTLPGDPYFNPLAFTTPAAGQFGNAGRTTIPGLFRIAVNSSLNRSFRFAESRRTLTFSVNAQQRVQSRDHHQHRDHGEFGELRPAHGGIGDPRHYTEFAFQLLRHMRNQEPDFHATDRS